MQRKHSKPKDTKTTSFLCSLVSFSQKIQKRVLSSLDALNIHRELLACCNGEGKIKNGANKIKQKLILNVPQMNNTDQIATGQFVPTHRLLFLTALVTALPVLNKKNKVKLVLK